MKRIVSQLDSQGYFLGPTMADESPLEPGVFLLPGGAIDAEPPEISAGKVARWSDGWVMESAPMVVTIPTPDVVQSPPQITEVQAAKLVAFLKANPDILAAAQL